ncbi:MAG TPA: 3-dehydroquinate synthase II [Spirochaetota bacterium]|nr:3-dehydroquinate synthase II [Spirochaetota bacterium]HOS33886.1 3-dehydroquinate synthase II [Spirochaetota bacterium]HOS33891.1 3-dehydroquinate synthase II [Spirochaetota bacterium]HOS56861.1 3-dehydroquinate synthase II [Spirochaetota bacterium]HPK62195.1 3-dehydroquinate synthase II [Spirochaetota bacterium]
MKKVWIEVENWEKSFITDCIENGIDAFFVSNKNDKENIEKLAKIDVFLLSELPDNIKFLNIKSKEDETAASKIDRSISLVLETGDWKIIPFENLIAVRDNLFASVNNLEDALEAVGILEKGVDGIYIKNCSNNDKITILKKLKSEKGKLEITTGEVLSVTKLSIGDRVCIDTISNMVDGEGMLVGDYSNGMVLVNSESNDNEYVASRPFRVNAGAVHCYVMTPEGRTKYLADLKSGDDVLIVNYKGETQTSVVGRIKLEKRPMLRIEVKGNIKNFSVVLQNAETIRIVTPDGKSKSVVQLKKGDKIATLEEKGGRHFGHKIEETIFEK